MEEVGKHALVYRDRRIAQPPHLPDDSKNCLRGDFTCRTGMCLEELLPAVLFGLLHETLDLLRASACGDEEGIWHIYDDEVVDSQ